MTNIREVLASLIFDSLKGEGLDGYGVGDEACEWTADAILERFDVSERGAPAKTKTQDRYEGGSYARSYTVAEKNICLHCGKNEEEENV